MSVATHSPASSITSTWITDYNTVQLNSLSLNDYDVTKDVEPPLEDRPVGAGGYGVVYCSQMSGRGKVALKRLYSGVESDRFARVRPICPSLNDLVRNEFTFDSG